MVTENEHGREHFRETKYYMLQPPANQGPSVNTTLEGDIRQNRYKKTVRDVGSRTNGTILEARGFYTVGIFA